MRNEDQTSGNGATGIIRALALRRRTVRRGRRAGAVGGQDAHLLEAPGDTQDERTWMKTRIVTIDSAVGKGSEVGHWIATKTMKTGTSEGDGNTVPNVLIAVGTLAGPSLPHQAKKTTTDDNMRARLRGNPPPLLAGLRLVLRRIATPPTASRISHLPPGIPIPKTAKRPSSRAKTSSAPGSEPRARQKLPNRPRRHRP